MASPASTLSVGTLPGPHRRFIGLTLIQWLGLLASILVAVLVGYLIGIGHAELALAVAVGIPLAALIAYSPVNGLLLWLLAAPYFVQTATADATPMTWLLFRLAVPGMLLMIVVYAALGLRRHRFRLGLVDLALVIFLGYGIGNTLLLAPNPQRMVVAFYTSVAVPIMLFWLVRIIDLRERDLRRLATVGAATILVQVLIGTVSWIEPGILPGQWLSRAGERTAGSFGGPGPFSITIVLYALVLLHVLLRDRLGRVQRVLTVGVIAMGLVAVFMTLSRGSWLGAGLAMLGVGVLYPVIALRVVVLGAVIGAVLGFGLLSEPFSSAAERLEDARTVDDRLITNQAAISMIGDRPTFGFGFGNFERFDERYKARVGDIPLEVGGSSHNTYLNFAAELGLVGLTLYLGVPLLLLVQTIRRWNHLPRDGLLSRPLVLFAWFALVDQVAVSNFLEMIHGNTWGTLVWWLSLGLIAVVLERSRVDAAGQIRREGE